MKTDLVTMSAVEASNAVLPEFAEDFNHRFAREPQSTHDAHRPLLALESRDQTFTLQEKRKVSSNLTLHYNRAMYLLESGELAEGARGKHVQVREYENGEVRIFPGASCAALPKRNRVNQSAIVSNKLLAGALSTRVKFVGLISKLPR